MEQTNTISFDALHHVIFLVFTVRFKLRINSAGGKTKPDSSNISKVFELSDGTLECWRLIIDKKDAFLWLIYSKRTELQNPAEQVGIQTSSVDVKRFRTVCVGHTEQITDKMTSFITNDKERLTPDLRQDLFGLQP